MATMANITELDGTVVTSSCVSNPDVAGNGVVISSVMAAILTMILSLLELFFDQSKKDEGPLRDILRDALSSLGLSQLVTGGAITLCIYIFYPQWDDPHCTMAFYLAMLAFVTQTCANFALRSGDHLDLWPTLLRCGLGLAQGLANFIKSLKGSPPSAIVSFNRTNTISAWLGTEFFIGIALTCILFALISMTLQFLNVWVYGERRKRWWERSRFVNRSRDRRKTVRRLRIAYRCIIAFLIVTFTTVLVVFVLKFKYASVESCPLNRGEDNEWTLGQVFAVLMLAAPAFQILEGLFSEMQRSVKMRRMKTKNIPSERSGGIENREKGSRRVDYVLLEEGKTQSGDQKA